MTLLSLSRPLEAAAPIRPASINVAEMFRSSYDAEKLCSSLVSMLKSSSDLHLTAQSAVRCGWQVTLANKQHAWTHLGVVAALFTTFLFTSIHEPFQVLEADDWLENHRERAHMVLTVALYLGISFGLVAVTLVLQLLVHSSQYVHSADDFLWFACVNRDVTADTFTVLCIMSTGVAVPAAAVVTLKHPEATVCLMCTSTCYVATLCWWLRSLCCAICHQIAVSRRTTDMLVELVMLEYRNSLELEHHCAGTALKEGRAPTGDRTGEGFEIAL
mmetsp:Transcript_45152/g.84270  ORF Transcript_45152/g.84270 Transcript_45152/m.84270 type:complete len:273 (-) Transcript_45152:72-890(-)